MKKLWVKELRNSSVLCGFKFVKENELVVLEGEVTLVNVKINQDRNAIKSEAFSDEMKNKIICFQF